MNETVNQNPFKPATKAQAKLRMAITGPAGCGKTYTALSIGSAFGKIACIDTERGSASKYAGLFSFDVLELENHDPEEYVKAIRAAVQYGYDVLVIDSMSHAWGNLLERVDAITKRSGNGNKFVAWADVTPVQNQFIDTILAAPLHVIATMRAKTEYVMESVEQANGRTKQVPRKLGLAPIQREQVDYEFDVMGMMDVEQNMTIIKTRCPEITGAMIQRPGKDDLGEVLKAWLTDGAPMPDDILSKWQRVTIEPTTAQPQQRPPTTQTHWSMDTETVNGVYDRLIKKEYAKDRADAAKLLKDAGIDLAKYAKVEDIADIPAKLDTYLASGKSAEPQKEYEPPFPPSNPSTPATDALFPPSDWQATMSATATAWTGMSGADVLVKLGKPSWATFKNHADANDALAAAIPEHQLPFICQAVTYKQFNKNGGVQMVFRAPGGKLNIPVKGGRGEIAKLMGGEDSFAYTEFAAANKLADWKPSNDLRKLDVPMLVKWHRDDKNALVVDDLTPQFPPDEALAEAS